MVITQEDYDYHRVERIGICSECEQPTHGVYPDDEGLVCEHCGEEGLMGVDAAIKEGFVQVKEE